MKDDIYCENCVTYLGKGEIEGVVYCQACYEEQVRLKRLMEGG